MVRSGTLAVFLLGILTLFLPQTFGAESPKTGPRGMTPDGDAAFRASYQKGESAWRGSYLIRMKGLRAKWARIAPVYFYRRTCGKGDRSRQVIVQIQKFDLSTILKDDASQLAFLLHVRWLLEVYWRRVVPSYRLEPKPVFIFDFQGISWHTFISYSFSINSLIKKINTAFHGVTGKGWNKTYILNPPSCFSSIWSAVTKLVTFRNEGVIIVKDKEKQKQLLEDTGVACLWEGLGGKSKMPLGTGVVEEAFDKFSQADDSVVTHNPDFARLTPEVENFPTPEAIAELQKEIAAGAPAAEGAEGVLSVSGADAAAAAAERLKRTLLYATEKPAAAETNGNVKKDLSSASKGTNATAMKAEESVAPVTAESAATAAEEILEGLWDVAADGAAGATEGENGVQAVAPEPNAESS